MARVTSVRFLGMWLDTRLTWNEHIDKIVNRCKRVLNIMMKCMAGQEWGADRGALQTVYIAMIRSVLDYGSIAYGLAAKSQLEKLDRIQAQAMRICCGAYPTTPIVALQVEINEMPLNIRRKQLMAVYWTNLNSQNEVHPTRKILGKCWEQGMKKHKSFGWVVEEDIKEMGINNYRCVPRVIYPHTPIWIIPQPVVDLTLLEIRQSEGNNGMEVMRANEYLRITYGDSIQIYTDASKKGRRVGVAVNVPKLMVKKKARISDQLSIYTGELMAILLGVQIIKERKIKNAVICSDSYSAIVSIYNQKSESRPDLIMEILQNLFELKQIKIEVQFMWVPAHVGIKGNEEADKLAKQVVDEDRVEIELSHSLKEIKSVIKEEMIKKWQQYWDNESKGRHLYAIQKKVGKGRKRGRNRREESIITRLRVGHTGLNKTLHLISKHPTGLCEKCGQSETVEHVFINCNGYDEEREVLREELWKNEGKELTLKNILDLDIGNSMVNVLFQFLNNTGLMNRM